MKLSWIQELSTFEIRKAMFCEPSSLIYGPYNMGHDIIWPFTCLDPFVKTKMTTMAKKHFAKKVNLWTQLVIFSKIFYGLFFFSFLNFQWPIENFMKSRTIFSNRMGKITIQCSERKRGQIKEFHRRCSVRGGNFYTNGKFLWQSFSLLPPVKSRQSSTGREGTNSS